ncbi:Xylogen-like protein 11 [Platanthera zijinensis]|uniref:Xylogen-like protein 11 n=1 Tax=Platanthera zijinensis TaxID=2320716 RepID=A0AAP0G093_9ASPA
MATDSHRILFFPILLCIITIPATLSLSPAPPPTLPQPAAAPSPAVPGTDCASSLLNLTSCLTYVEQGSNSTVPEKGCCPSLAGLVESSPICLCQLLSTSDSFGFKIDTTRALMLPTICHVQTPPVSLCNDLGIPVASPGPLSPAGGGGEQPAGSGLAPATPTTGTPSNGGDGTSAAGAATLLARLAVLATAGQAISMIFF